jgi:hypothetical protein
MSSPHIAYQPRPAASPEGERRALASVYSFILDRCERKKGGPATAPDARKESNGSGKVIIPRQP